MDITQALITAIKNIPALFPSGASDPQWTEAVKLAVGRVGLDLGYRVYGHGEHFETGWLFDLCWSLESGDRNLVDMPLALESEWKRKYDDIRYDFDKLIIAKARYKVMIFQATGKNIGLFFDLLEQGISRYRGGSHDETYILACFDYDETRWEFIFRTVKVPNQLPDPSRP